MLPSLALGVLHTGPEPGYRSGKQCLVLRRPRQHDGALDAQYRILGSLAGVRWVPVLADKSVSEGANPSDEVSGDCGGKPIACSVESKSTDEANAPARRCRRRLLRRLRRAGRRRELPAPHRRKAAAGGAAWSHATRSRPVRLSGTENRHNAIQKSHAEVGFIG